MLSLITALLLSAPSLRVVGVLSDGTMVLETDGHYDLVAPGESTPSAAPEGWVLPAVLPMVAGAVSPSLGHAVVIVRDAAEQGWVTIERLDAQGRHAVAQLDPSCPPAADEAGPPAPIVTGGTTLLTVHWADGALTGGATRAVVTGALPACGETVRPVVLVVDAGPPMSAEQRLEAARELTARIAGGVMDPLVAEAATGLAPGLPDPLVALAQTRVAADDPGGAIAALWALSASAAPEAAEHLRAAMAADWATPLRARAAYRALEWTLAPTLEPTVSP